MAITQEFKEFCEYMGIEAEAAYDKMKREMIGEVKFEELPVSVVLRDIQQMRAVGPSINAMLVEDMIAHPMFSYSDLANRFHLCKMTVWRILKKESGNKPWLKALILYKSSAMEGKGGVVGEGKGGKKNKVGSSVRG